MVARTIDVVGKTFGRLTVISEEAIGVREKRRVVCLCACGRQVVRLIYGLETPGRIPSCGCYRHELKQNYRHGGARAADRSAEYNTWCGMKQRCLNPKNHKYKDYGGRGITICKRWLKSFAVFLDDMGPRPTPEHTIDRIDNNGNYEPSNCRWATKKEQVANQRERERTQTNAKSLSNLKPMTSDWQRRIWNTSRLKSRRKPQNCRHCGDSFLSKCRKNDQPYCSAKCYHASRCRIR